MLAAARAEANAAYDNGIEVEGWAGTRGGQEVWLIG